MLYTSIKYLRNKTIIEVSVKYMKREKRDNERTRKCYYHSGKKRKKAITVKKFFSSKIVKWQFKIFRQCVFSGMVATVGLRLAPINDTIITCYNDNNYKKIRKVNFGFNYTIKISTIFLFFPIFAFSSKHLYFFALQNEMKIVSSMKW